MNFGEKLKQLRRSLGKSQTQVADEINEMTSGEFRISQTTLSALEQKDVPPRGDMLEILAQYFGVPITYFFDTEEEQEQRVRLAKNYLEALKDGKSPDFGKIIFARSEGLRSNNDDVTQSLNDLLAKYDGNVEDTEADFDSDEFLDS